MINMMEDNQTQLSACSSIAKPTPAKNHFEQKECFILKAIYESLLNELIEEEILEICFEVHKAVKLGRNAAEPTETMTMKNIRMEVDSDVGTSQSVKSKTQNITVICPLCKEKKSPYVFAKHLSCCMGLEENEIKRKASSREAIRKIVEALNSDSENDSDSDTNRRAKKGRWKKKK